MCFEISAESLKKSVKCPPGMHLGRMTECEEPYVKENGYTVQKCDFETDKGYIVSVWFNDAVMSNLIEFIEAADKIKFNMDDLAKNAAKINLRDYLNKPVAFSISHQKDKNNKIQANIDNFFNADKVPF